jgi:hypothetical protein
MAQMVVPDRAAFPCRQRKLEDGRRRSEASVQVVHPRRIANWDLRRNFSAPEFFLNFSVT